MNKEKFFYSSLIFLVFFGVSLIAYRLVFRLSLYGDDWAVIAKFFHIYGSGNSYPYYRIDTWVYEYGFMMGIFAPLTLIFGYQPAYFYLTSLFFRSILAFAIYYFVQKIFSKKVATASALFFSISCIGSETTEWVFQMSAYLGVAIALFGLAGLTKKDKPFSDFKNWMIIMFGYVVVPIRLYLLPFFLPVLELLKWLTIDRKDYRRLFFGVIVSGSLFPLLKRTFPLIANVDRNALNYGIDLGKSLLSSGRTDFILYPFLNLGRMILPVGFEELQTLLKLQIVPIKNFPVPFVLLVFIGAVLFCLNEGKLTRKKVISKIWAAILIIASLRVFTYFQGAWNLNDFAKFSWTYLGITLFIITINRLYREYRDQRWSVFAYYLIALAFTFSFIYTQVSNPLFLFLPTHRYLLVPGIGIVLLLSTLLFQNFFQGKNLALLRIILVLALLISHLTTVQSYFGFMELVRSKDKNDLLFSQIKQNIPFIPIDYPTVFYFEYPNPTTFHLLLRFGFGYHMLLYYNIPFDEINMPSSASNFEELASLVKEKKPPLDHIYGLRWIGDSKSGKFININDQVRKKVVENGLDKL